MTTSISAVFAAGLQLAALHIGPASDMTHEWHWCVDAEGARSTGGRQANAERSIQGCTAVIESGHATSGDLVLAFLFRGVSYYRIGDYDRAIADLTESIKLNSTNATAFNARGASYSAKGQYDRAIEDFDTAIRLQSDYGDAFLNRSKAFFSKGDYARALSDIDQAIRLMPTEAEAFSERCWVRAVQAIQLDTALADCNRALTLEPNNYRALDRRGFVYFRLNQLDKALADYGVLLTASPRQASALYMRGVVRRRMGDGGGDADIAAAKAIDPKIEETYAKYGVTP